MDPLLSNRTVSKFSFLGILEHCNNWSLAPTDVFLSPNFDWNCSTYTFSVKSLVLLNIHCCFFSDRQLISRDRHSVRFFCDFEVLMSGFKYLNLFSSCQTWLRCLAYQISDCDRVKQNYFWVQYTLCHVARILGQKRFRVPCRVHHEIIVWCHALNKMTDRFSQLPWLHTLKHFHSVRDTQIVAMLISKTDLTCNTRIWNFCLLLFPFFAGGGSNCQAWGRFLGTFFRN